MDLDKRSHDFLLYTQLRQYIDDPRMTTKDWKWLVEYLEGRLDYYASKVDKMQQVMDDGRTLNVVSDILRGILKDEEV